MGISASKLLVGPVCGLLILPVACTSTSEPPGQANESSGTPSESTGGSVDPTTSAEAVETGSGTQQGTEETGGTSETGVGGCERASPSMGSIGADAPAGFDRVFDRQGQVWGLHLYATEGVSDANLLHATHVLGQYIDNDENCEADDAAVLASLQENKASMVLFATDAELENNIDVLEGAFESHGLQDLYDFEIRPNGASQGEFDATLEEVLHLVTSYGWSQAHAADFAERDSSMASAMDTARGGHFETIPESYPEEAWYHYDDSTCEYECMATEYFYWSLTSLLGGQDFEGRCPEIANEWEACTAAQFEAMDLAMTGLLTDKGYALPTTLPDGSYEPAG